MGTELTGRTVGLMLNAALGSPLTTAVYEGQCAGDFQTLVRGVAVCYAPTFDVLRRAAAERKNLIVTREHPFFLHGGFNYTYSSSGLEAALKDDPVVEAKRSLITANKLMVYRIGAAWDQFRPRSQSLALAQALGLAPIAASPLDRSRGGCGLCCLTCLSSGGPYATPVGSPGTEKRTIWIPKSPAATLPNTVERPPPQARSRNRLPRPG